MTTSPPAFTTAALTALRVVGGLAFASHGAQKLLGWFGGFGPDGGTAELMSRFGLAGIIELVGGVLIAIGLFTRPAAFLASGLMAAAYLTAHWGFGSNSFWWWANGGELAMIFCFLWLFFSARGAGPHSLDARMGRDRTAP